MKIEYQFLLSVFYVPRSASVGSLFSRFSRVMSRQQNSLYFYFFLRAAHNILEAPEDMHLFDLKFFQKMKYTVMVLPYKGNILKCSDDIFNLKSNKKV